jgi:hypothetical protein
MVEDRPRNPRRAGAPTWGDEREERTDLVESVRNSEPAAGEARFMEAAARATCVEEGISVVSPPCSGRRGCASLMAVRGGLSGLSDWAE